MGTGTAAAGAAELRARVGRLAGDAEEVEWALRAVERRAAALAWAGPVRDAFADALGARVGELRRAAEALREEADRLAGEAALREQEPDTPPGGRA